MLNRWVYVTTLFLDRLSPVRNWQLHGPSWISGRERMTVENVSCSLSMTERCLTRRGSSPRPPDHSESDVRRTEPPRPADILSCNCEGHAFWTLVSATCSFSSIGWPKWHILYAAWVDLYYFFCTPGFDVVGFRCGRVSVWSGFGVVPVYVAQPVHSWLTYCWYDAFPSICACIYLTLVMLNRLRSYTHF